MVKQVRGTSHTLHFRNQHTIRHTVMPVCFSEEVQKKCIVVSHSKNVRAQRKYRMSIVIIFLEDSSLLSVSPLHTSTKALVHRNTTNTFCIGSLEHDEAKYGRLCMCNIVAERMRYPHLCIFKIFLIQYNSAQRTNDGHPIEVTTKNNFSSWN